MGLPVRRPWRGFCRAQSDLAGRDRLVFLDPRQLCLLRAHNSASPSRVFMSDAAAEPRKPSSYNPTLAPEEARDL